MSNEINECSEWYINWAILYW